MSDTLDMTSHRDSRMAGLEVVVVDAHKAALERMEPRLQMASVR